MSLSQTGDFNLSLTTGGSIEDTVTALIDVVKQQQETINDLQETVGELRDAVDDERAERTKDIANDRQRLTDVEERLDDGSDGSDPTPDAEKDRSSTPSTPLERVCAFSEEVAERELTANQSRARFVASDVTDYADSVPAGYAIPSGSIATVLKAGTDSKGRTQTVARVMDFLDDLGGDGVEVVERRGTKRVVFTEGAARRLERLSSTPSSSSDNGVVIGRGT